MIRLLVAPSGGRTLVAGSVVREEAEDRAGWDVRVGVERSSGFCVNPAAGTGDMKSDMALPLQSEP